MSGAERNSGTKAIGAEPIAFAGWCPDCGIESAIVEYDAAGDGWATCTECESGWVAREDAGATSLAATESQSEAHPVAA